MIVTNPLLLLTWNGLIIPSPSRRARASEVSNGHYKQALQTLGIQMPVCISKSMFKVINDGQNTSSGFR